METWKPTQRGGFRRTGIAQGQSTAQMRRRRAVRLPCPVRVKWAERLGLPDCPYVIRWRLETTLGSVRVHHWLAPDDPRAFHDHPWWFITVIIKGGYADHTPTGVEHLRAGSIRYRSALHQHTVVPDVTGAWTVLIIGAPRRAWGFWFNGKFRKANKWFLTHGHHPCT